MSLLGNAIIVYQKKQTNCFRKAHMYSSSKIAVKIKHLKMRSTYQSMEIKIKVLNVHSFTFYNEVGKSLQSFVSQKSSSLFLKCFMVAQLNSKFPCLYCMFVQM